LSEQAAHHAFIQSALELAAKGRGRTSPNPMVGAVLVQEGRIVGEGYHHKAGEPHAEVHALEHAGALSKGATLYVTLEPCCHWGRTPPCTQALIRAGVAKVYAAMQDVNPRVAGKGFAELKGAGIEVHVGLCEAEARRLNEAYIKHTTTCLPFVILKAAMSLDGKIATASGESQWITSEAARLKGHALRDQVDAILVGVGTVLADNPSLTTRLRFRNADCDPLLGGVSEGRGGLRNKKNNPKSEIRNPKSKDPIRVVADSRGRTPPNAKVFNPDSNAKTLIAVTDAAPQDAVAAFKAAGAEVITVAEKDGRVCLLSLMRELGNRQITSVLIEGGAEIHASALQEGVVDKVMFFIAPKLIGGREAPGPIGGVGVQHLSAAISLRETNVTRVGEDFFIEGYIAKGAA